MASNGWPEPTRMVEMTSGRAQYETIVTDGTTEPSVEPPKKCSLIARISERKSRFLDAYERFFLNLGGFIFDHPSWFIGISLFVVFVCSLSFFFIHFETRADLLYALPASQARSDLAKLTTGFGVPPRVNMVFVVSKENSTILTPQVLRKMERLDYYIKHQLKSSPHRKSSKPGESRVWAYEDVCYRMRLPDVNFSAVADEAEGAPTRRLEPISHQDQCHTMSPLDLYRGPRQYGTPLATRQWPYIPNIAANKIVKADLVLTDPHVVRLTSGTTRLLNATGFLFLYHTESGDPKKLVASLAWEEAFIDFINNRIKPYAAPEANKKRLHRLKTERKNYEETYYTVDELSHMDADKFIPFNDLEWSDYHVFVNAQRSWQDELGRSTSFDARLVRDYTFAYLIIAAYMIVMNRTNNLVRSKSICGFIGSLSALFGFVVGGGFCYWLGLRHTPTMHAAPFLVLAIGLDNTFVVLNFYTLAHSYAKEPRKRCAMALSDAGISITITTFTSIISFLVGAVGPYLAVRNFCYVTAMGLLGGYVMNIVLFFPFLCLESVAESKDEILFVPVPKWIIRYLIPRSLIPPKAWVKVFPEDERSPSPTVTSLELQKTGHTDVAPSDHRPNPLAATMPFVPLFGPRVEKGSATPPTSPRTCRLQGATSKGSVPVFNQTQPLPHMHATWRHLPYAGFRTGTSRTDSDVFEDRGGANSLPSEQSHPSSPSPFLRDKSISEDMSEDDLKRLCYIYNEFFPGKSIFELASLQWRFTKRLRELRKEMKRRKMPIPKGSNDLDLEQVRTEDLKNVDAMLTPAPQIPHTVLPALTHVIGMVAKASDEPQGNVGRMSRGVFLHFLGPLISRPWVQVSVLLLMATYLSASLYGAVTRLSAGLDLENLTPPDSYLREAFALSHDKFPIFPYETSVLFTAPDYRKLSALSGRVERGVDQGQELLDVFNSNEYGTRRASDLKPLRLDDPEAHSGSGAGTAETMQRYWETLGEVPWWEPGTVQGFFDLDRVLREMPTTQDVLNGMLLFYIENSQKILENGKTHEERRLLFHQSLYRWLKGGVVGQHVRNQFRFADPHPDDPLGLPRLLGFRLMIFNYNFLNSFEQSQYMIEIRDKCARASTNWKVLYDEGEVRAIESGEEMQSQISHPMFALAKATRPEYPQLMVPEAPTTMPAGSGRLDVEPKSAIAGPGQWGVEWQSLFAATPFMETFLYFESDVTILSATIVNMATAFIAIVLVSFMLMRGWLTSVLVTLMICCVDLGIFGFMGFWSIHLNILSMILLVLSIGFSVDYTVHVVHTFTHCYGTTRRDKTVETLILMCNPVTHGAVSTLLGVLPIAFRKEFIMETFYRMTLLVVVFGFLNGVIFLPIILGLCGPVFSSTKRDTIQMNLEVSRKLKPLWRADDEELKKVEEKICIKPIGTAGAKVVR